MSCATGWQIQVLVQVTVHGPRLCDFYNTRRFFFLDHNVARIICSDVSGVQQTGVLCNEVFNHQAVCRPGGSQDEREPGGRILARSEGDRGRAAQDLVGPGCFHRLRAAAR